MARKVALLLHTKNVWLLKIPINMRQLFQFLTLTIKEHCKLSMKVLDIESILKMPCLMKKKVKNIEVKLLFNSDQIFTAKNVNGAL